jgi:hypothetical protein
VYAGFLCSIALSLSLSLSLFSLSLSLFSLSHLERRLRHVDSFSLSL